MVKKAEFEQPNNLGSEAKYPFDVGSWSLLEHTRHQLRQVQYYYREWQEGNPNLGIGGTPPRASRINLLQVAEPEEDREIEAGYLSQINNLEQRISEIRLSINEATYDPYEVLELKKGASWKKIENAYERLRAERLSSVSMWAKPLDELETGGLPLGLEEENREWAHVYFTHHLEWCQFRLRQVEIAFKKLEEQRN